MRDSPCLSGCRPHRSPLRCEPSCRGRSGSHESWEDRRARGSIRRLRIQKMRRSSQVPAGRRAEVGLRAQNGRPSAVARRWPSHDAEMTRRYSSRVERHLRQETSRGVWKGAYLPTSPSGLLLTASSTGDPPGLNRTQNTSSCAPLRVWADTNESQKQTDLFEPLLSTRVALRRIQTARCIGRKVFHFAAQGEAKVLRSCPELL